MRTGAIFARGSCRALKWMALFGVVFALVAGQAAAQTPATMSSATYTGDTVSPVTVTMSAAVTLRDVKATDFTLRVSATDTSTLLATGSSLVQSADKTKLTLVLDTPPRSVTAVAAWTLHYTAPDPATRPGEGMFSADGGVTVTGSIALTAEAIALALPNRIPEATATVGVAYKNTLPAATGGDGTYTYTLAGPVVDTDADDTRSLEFAAATRVLSGTPKAADVGEHVLTYSVSDGAGASASRTFVLTINAAPDTPTPTGNRGRITKIEVIGASEKDVGGTKRMHVTEGVLTTVKVTIEWTHAQLRALWADGTPDPVAVMLEMMESPGTGNAAKWLSGAEKETGHDDVTIGTAAMVAPPKIPATRSTTSRGTDTEFGSTTLHFGRDPDAEEEGFKLMVTNTADFEANSVVETGVHVIEDIDPQGVKIERVGTGVIYEGRSDVKFDVTANPRRVQLPLDVRFDLVDVTGQTVKSRDNYIDKAGGEIPAGSGSTAKYTATLTLDNNDMNRTDDTLELHVEVVEYALDTGAYGGIEEPDPVEIEVVDIHKLPMLTVSPESEMLMEGGELELTLTINRNPPDTIVINPETREYTSEPIDVMVDMLPEGINVMPRPVKFPEHNKKEPWTQKMKVKVSANPNGEIDGERMVTLTFEAAGTVAANGMGAGDGDKHMAVATLTVEDATTKLVWAKTQEEVEAAVYAAKNAAMGDDMTLNPGEMIEVMGSALFNAAEGVTLSYTAESDMSDVASASVSGGTAMVAAESEGMAHITITAHASMPSGVMVLDQSDPREASVMFPVEVGLEALSIMLSGPEDMNLAEGMSAMVTATANRAVTDDTTVMLMRDRAMSSASDDDFTADAIMIEAGEMMGSTMVMAVEDNMMEDMEELVLYGMTEGMAGEVTGEVKLYLWDAAVPALPIIAQLLLAGILGIGGYRRYRRR